MCACLWVVSRGCSSPLPEDSSSLDLCCDRSWRVVATSESASVGAFISSKGSQQFCVCNVLWTRAALNDGVPQWHLATYAPATQTPSNLTFIVAAENVHPQSGGYIILILKQCVVLDQFHYSQERLSQVIQWYADNSNNHQLSTQHTKQLFHLRESLCLVKELVVVVRGVFFMAGCPFPSYTSTQPFLYAVSCFLYAIIWQLAPMAYV